MSSEGEELHEPEGFVLDSGEHGGALGTNMGRSRQSSRNTQGDHHAEWCGAGYMAWNREGANVE